MEVLEELGYLFELIACFQNAQEDTAVPEESRKCMCLTVLGSYIGEEVETEGKMASLYAIPQKYVSSFFS